MKVTTQLEKILPIIEVMEKQGEYVSKNDLFVNSTEKNLFLVLKIDSSMVYFDLKKEFFEKAELVKEKIFFNTNRFKSALKSFKKGEIYIITTEDKIKISNGTKSYNLPLYNEEEEFKVPNVAFPVVFSVTKDYFKEFCEDITRFDTAQITFSCKDSSIKAETYDTDYPFKTTVVAEIIEKKDCKGNYITNNIAKQEIHKLDVKSFEIGFGFNIPLKISANGENYYFELWSSPLVENA